MKNIHFAAPITHETSYGIVALNLTEQLSYNSDINLSISPIGGVSYDPFLREQNLDHLHNKGLTKDITSIVLFHQGMMSPYHHPNATRRIGFPIFELTGFSQKELDDLGEQDELMVCSHWAKSILENYFPSKPIHVVPLGYNPKIFKFNPVHQNRHSQKTVFLSVGKWEHRKCHTELAQIFRSAFSPLDNVLLLMCPYNGFIGPQENERLKNEYKKVLGNQVHFIDRVDSQQQLANVYGLSDVFCGVSRSEGYGLPLFESIVLGKLSISSNYAGHTEFVNKGNSLLVEPTELESAFDGFWFDGTKGNWMKIGKNQIDQYIHWLRTVHNTVKTVGHKNYEHIHNSVSHFTWENSANKLVEALE